MHRDIFEPWLELHGIYIYIYIYGHVGLEAVGIEKRDVEMVENKTEGLIPCFDLRQAFEEDLPQVEMSNKSSCFVILLSHLFSFLIWNTGDGFSKTSN